MDDIHPEEQPVPQPQNPGQNLRTPKRKFELSLFQLVLFGLIFAAAGGSAVLLTRAAPVQPSGSVSTASTTQELEINLAYNSKLQPDLQIQNAKVKNGQPPLYDTENAAYSAQLLSSDGQIIKTIQFALPNTVIGPPPQKGETQVDQNISLAATDFTIDMQWNSSAKTLKVLKTDGSVVAAKDLANIPVVNNHVIDHSVRGDKFKSSGFSSSESSGFLSRKAYAATNQLDITFIGNDYGASGLATFHDDVNRFITQILAIEPYKSRAAQITFHYVDNTSDLGCNYKGRIITCNKQKVIQQITNSGTPYDAIAVIENNSTYGGATVDPISVSYNGTVGPLVFVHETGGHLIGHLVDEYELGQKEYSMVNCSKTDPNSLWSTLVAAGDYNLSCDYKTYYRSSSESIMITLAAPYFNAVSQKAVNAKIDYYAGKFSDSTSPTASITAPASGSALSAPIPPVQVSASDNQGVARVELRDNGVLYQTIYAEPYQFNWQPAAGSHTIQAFSYDTAGNVGTSNSITVVVK